MSFDLSFYNGKKVLLTGHTGFKGSWMSVMLKNAGAEVLGYSSCSKTETRLFDLCGVKDQIRHVKGDVRDLDHLLEVFADYEVPVEQIPSGVDSFSVVFPSESIRNRKEELMHELSEFESIDNCTLTEGISLIAIVGRQMAYRTGISGKIFKTLGENKINIRTIEQGADEINIMVGVYDDDFEKAIRLLYESFAKK